VPVAPPILSAPFRYLADLGNEARRGWDRFFFAPADPTTLGLVRILVGALLLWEFALIGVDWRLLLASDGWVDPNTLREFWSRNEGQWAWSFWPLVPDRLIPVAFLACYAVLILFTLGLWTRVTAILAWVVLASTAQRMMFQVFGFDSMMTIWMLYLAASGASGQALSVDRWLARRRGGLPKGPPTPTVSANLGLRMIQLHLCLIYGIAGLGKLKGESWWNGTAVAMVIMTPEFRLFDLSWLLAYPRLMNVMTHGGLLLELLYPVLIWVRPLRPLMIASAILLHLGIDLTLGLFEFGLAMTAANLAFVPGDRLRALWERPSHPLAT
jgi:hypothetical protein